MRGSNHTYLSLFDNERFKEFLKKGFIEIENGGFLNQTDVDLESNPVLAVFEMR